MLRRWQRILPYLLLALAALFAVHPLMVHGCSCGHDFDFHLESWLDAASQFRHGEFHPHWAFSPAWNAGEPRFVFYPPLSWYLGAIIGLFLSHLPSITEAAAWTAAPIVFTWITLALAGATMFRLARDYALPTAAGVAAAAYLANPYMLFTAYERTAYAELLAAAWMPALLHGLLRPRISIPRIAIPLALLWLTNAPAAVIGSYMLAFVALYRAVSAFFLEKSPQESRLLSLVRSRRLSPRMLRIAGALNLGLPIVAATALGLLCAAFYIVPAAWEQRFVRIHMAEIPGMQIADNFLFHHTTGPDAVLHDQVLHTASVVAVTLWASAVVFLGLNYLLCRRTHAVDKAAAGLRVLPTALLASLAVAVGFFLTPPSEPLWLRAPEAQFLQFPWRSVSVLAVVAALALAALITRLGRRLRGGFLPALLILIAFVVPAYLAFRQACDPEDEPGAQLASFSALQGFDPTDEYTPVIADNDALAHGNPPYWLTTRPGEAAPQSNAPGSAPLSLTLRLPRAEDLILNLRDYPAWQLMLDGAPDLQRLSRPDGLIAVPLPAGTSMIELHYMRLPDQKIGDALTLLGVGLLIAAVLPQRWRLSHNPDGRGAGRDIERSGG